MTCWINRTYGKFFICGGSHDCPHFIQCPDGPAGLCEDRGLDGTRSGPHCNSEDARLAALAKEKAYRKDDNKEA